MYSKSVQKTKVLISPHQQLKSIPADMNFSDFISSPESVFWEGFFVFHQLKGMLSSHTRLLYFAQKKKSLFSQKCMYFSSFSLTCSYFSHGLSQINVGENVSVIQTPMSCIYIEKSTKT